MNLATRIYRLLRTRLANVWVPQEDIVELAVAAGYGRGETIDMLEKLSRLNPPNNARMFVRRVQRSNKAQGIEAGVFYRWTDEDDDEKARLERLKWFEEYPCGCSQQGYKHGR